MVYNLVQAGWHMISEDLKMAIIGIISIILGVVLGIILAPKLPPVIGNAPSITYITTTVPVVTTIIVNHTVTVTTTTTVVYPPSTTTITATYTTVVPTTVVTTTTVTTTVPIYNTTTIVKTITITLTPNATRPIPYSCNITLFQLPNGTAWLIGVLLYPILWTNENWSNPSNPLKLPGTSFVGTLQLPHGVEYGSLMPLWFNISIPSLQGGMYWVNYTWNGYYVYVFGTTTGFGGFKAPSWLLGADWLNGTFDCRIIHINVPFPAEGLAYTFTGAEYVAWTISLAVYGKPAPCYVPAAWTVGGWVYRVRGVTPNGTNWQYYCGPNGTWASLKP